MIVVIAQDAWFGRLKHLYLLVPVQLDITIIRRKRIVYNVRVDVWFVRNTHVQPVKLDISIKMDSVFVVQILKTIQFVRPLKIVK